MMQAQKEGVKYKIVLCDVFTKNMNLFDFVKFVEFKYETKELTYYPRLIACSNGLC
jgi:hypothetical protein